MLCRSTQATRHCERRDCKVSEKKVVRDSEGGGPLCSPSKEEEELLLRMHSDSVALVRRANGCVHQ